MDHSYSNMAGGQSQRHAFERTPAIFGVGHMYSKRCNSSTTVRSPSTCDSRKRERSSPTGKTPQQPSKIGSAVLPSQKRNIPWTEAEKDYFKHYVHEMPRGNHETLTGYWQKCSVAMNTKYPCGMRNGLSCKALSQRLFVTPSTSNQISSVASLDDTDIAAGFHMLSTDLGTPVTRDVETQTTLSFPVNTDRGSYKDDSTVDNGRRSSAIYSTRASVAFFWVKSLAPYLCNFPEDSPNLKSVGCS